MKDAKNYEFVRRAVRSQIAYARSIMMNFAEVNGIDSPQVRQACVLLDEAVAEFESHFADDPIVIDEAAELTKEQFEYLRKSELPSFRFEGPTVVLDGAITKEELDRLRRVSIEANDRVDSFDKSD